MTVLYWLLVPLLVTALAAGWIMFAHRSRPRADPRESMAEHERFRQAMERPAPAPRRPTSAEEDTGLSA
ncbi:MAG TPA: hypothetical protein VEV13_03465 [Candidatus Limnocylindria bacterium]|nr:hypothetical protein [Candidatus Limnocylindria bacterium]